MAGRSQREQEAYDKGLKRDGYIQVLRHSSHLFVQRRNQIISKKLLYGQGKEVLELGAATWTSWIEKNHIHPAALYCINISQKELDNGIAKACNSKVKPHFQLMDANRLEFENESLDLVYGCAILHHLDFEQALDEVYRVLKPGGRILFAEPLGINPVGKLLRVMTPSARTVDEKPLMYRELARLDQKFDTCYYFEELFSTPIGVLSGLLFNKPDNWLTRFALKFDLVLGRIFPPLRFFFRNVLVTGYKK